jgi:hypothetical protein
LKVEEGGGPPTDISRPAASAPWCILTSFHLPPLTPLALPSYSYSPPQTRRTRVGGSAFNISLFYFIDDTSAVCSAYIYYINNKYNYYLGTRSRGVRSLPAGGPMS